MSSTNTYSDIKPCRLMVKQHAITKLKYFCKTNTKNYLKYCGSGVGWTEHLKEHGKQHVITLWVSKIFTNREEISKFAIQFSIENQIVESDQWANRIIETGIGGGGKRNTKQYFNIITNQYELLLPHEVLLHHIKLKDSKKQIQAKEKNTDFKFFVDKNGKQFRSKEQLNELKYKNTRINFGKNGNYFSNNIKMINLFTKELKFFEKSNIPEYHVLHNSKYIFCIRTPDGLKMSHSQEKLKLHFGTKGLKELIDNDIIHIRTKNKWLKSNFLGKKVSDIGFKYYSISEITKDLLETLIKEGYKWV